MTQPFGFEGVTGPPAMPAFLTVASAAGVSAFTSLAVKQIVCVPIDSGALKSSTVPPVSGDPGGAGASRLEYHLKNSVAGGTAGAVTAPRIRTEGVPVNVCPLSGSMICSPTALTASSLSARIEGDRSARRKRHPLV